MRIEFSTWFFSITTLTIFCSITIPVHSKCLEHQKSLLFQLKNSLQFDPNSSVKLVNWTQSNDCCQWNGVTCDHSGRVIGLDLNTESISGGLNHSSSLFGLEFLENLNLAYNSFNFTPIPSSFGFLTNLKYLNLSETEIAGQIPMEFSRLTRLVKLDISSDFDSGLEAQTIQIENPNLFTLFRNLSGITELYLDGANISANGYEWGKAISSALPNLRVLSLFNCYLSGPIDSSLQNLQYLSEINLANNNLSCPVPDFFANFANLTALSLSSCNLYGTFPDVIFERVQTLETLDLSGNRLLNGRLPDFPQNLRNLVISGTNFSGPIPNSLANLGQLVYFDLSFNNFSGQIPSFQGSKKLTYIDLSNNALTGVVLSTHFEGLLDLLHIDLSSNCFNGSIPSSLFSLPSLRDIQLSNNKFSGPITGFSNESLCPLVLLDLSSNKLEGPIPSYFFHCQSLSILSLSFNSFSGNVDLESFQRLQNLDTLQLSYNNLTVSASITNSSLLSFPQLSTLRLAACKLQNFPPPMNQSCLNDLDLSNNQISGVIPNWIWNICGGVPDYLNLSCNHLVGFEPEFSLHSISVLDLHSNQLQGEIPIPKSSDYVDYSRNNFSSFIPAEIGNSIASASFFSLSDNMLSGTIPPSICSGRRLEVLDLSNNGLSGAIPKCLIDAAPVVLNLYNNNLTGNITGTFPEDCALRTLDLSGNNLEGQVPKSLANCADVEVLNLGNNNINGNFPCFLTNLSTLRVLVLRSNKFHGNINCRGIYNNIWPKLQIIDLALNNFSGILPPQFFSQRKAMMDGANAKLDLNLLRFRTINELYYQDSMTVINKGVEMKLVKILTIFTTIDFSNNNFKGEIPYAIGDLKSLHVLNLSHNALRASIPSSLGNLTQLESLDLSWNKLGGSIPVALASLTFLSFMNLSYNQLIGMIPTGSQLQTFQETSFKGNKGLCGAPLIASCGEPVSTRPAFDNRQEDEINWVYITATLGYTVGFGVIVGPLLYSKRWRQCYYKPVDRVILRILHHREQRAKHQKRRDNINQLRRRQHH